MREKRQVRHRHLGKRRKGYSKYNISACTFYDKCIICITENEKNEKQKCVHTIEATPVLLFIAIDVVFPAGQFLTVLGQEVLGGGP